MPDVSRLSRRALIGAGLGAAATPLLAQPTAGLAGADPRLDPWLAQEALDALAHHGDRIVSRDVIGVVDFGLPSYRARLHLIDIVAGRSRTLLVAHGKGSDPNHLGMVQRLSNIDGSLMSSAGAYLVDEPYEGIHGLSCRLVGLDPGNAAAYDRAIVIHSAWYVGSDVIAKQGRLGRSDGCFVVAPSEIAAVLTQLRSGRMLYAGVGGGPGRTAALQVA